MFKSGPIPPFVHGVVDYGFAALLIASSFLFGFDSDTATWLSVAVGVLVLIIAACTAWTAGIIKSIPVPAHVMLDLLTALFLIAAPFLFGFDDDGSATAVFIVAGVLDLLLAIATRFLPDGRERGRRREKAGS